MRVYSLTDSRATLMCLCVLIIIDHHRSTIGFWPGYVAYNDPRPLDYGLQKVDHVVGNVYRMDQVVSNFKRLFGLHTFAFFTQEQIKTQWTSLNSEVLASNDARVLMPINEPAPGKAESQILTYLRYFNGPGVQHIAIKSSDIFKTLSILRYASVCRVCVCVCVSSVSSV
jgi:4-hydroxyphenylpyruvate dioxygenase